MLSSFHVADSLLLFHFPTTLVVVTSTYLQSGRDEVIFIKIIE